MKTIREREQTKQTNWKSSRMPQMENSKEEVEYDPELVFDSEREDSCDL